MYENAIKEIVNKNACSPSLLSCFSTSLKKEHHNEIPGITPEEEAASIIASIAIWSHVDFIKAQAKIIYDFIEASNFSVDQAVNFLENAIELAPHPSRSILTNIRNDMSTHMGPINGKFDRKKHTHNGTELNFSC